MKTPQEDPIVSLMKTLNLPQTREQYLELAYLEPWGIVYLGPEEEAELPEQFQHNE
jgi:hypothetical protein